MKGGGVLSPGSIDGQAVSIPIFLPANQVQSTHLVDWGNAESLFRIFICIREIGKRVCSERLVICHLLLIPLGHSHYDAGTHNC